jgi:hypothetical protein
VTVGGSNPKRPSGQNDPNVMVDAKRTIALLDARNAVGARRAGRE